MKRSVLIIGIFVVVLAALLGFVLIRASERDRQSAYLYLNSTLRGDPEFRYLYTVNASGSNFDNYIYQSLDGEIQYANDCIGCNSEVGDTFFFHSYVSAKMSREIYDRKTEAREDETAKLEVLEQSPSRDRAMTRVSQNGKTVRVSLVWLENDELWEITSIDERHVVAFQRSQFFHMIKPK